MMIEQSSHFARSIKKLRANQRQDVDSAVNALSRDPMLGEVKKGDLATIRVYKFSMAKQLTLLAYSYYEERLTLRLLALGSHENFYRDLKKH